MLTFLGNSHSFCDGIGRREFLQLGGLAMGGLTLNTLLAAEAKAGINQGRKSLINIYLGGGPTHLDTFDLKPLAPAEYRGEFKPILTNAPGVEICELMPELATVADKFSLIRSVDKMNNEHNAKQSESGWSQRSLMPLGGRPGVGAVMSKVFGPAQDTRYGTAPTCVDLTGWTRPGFLGQVHSAYQPDGNGRANLTLNRSIDAKRLDDRQALLDGLDRYRRDADRNGMMTAMDSFSERAVGMITSGKMAEALDLKTESPETLSRYGVSDRGNRRARDNERFIYAKRLIEAGVRCVSFSWGGWDTHSNNFRAMREQLPPLSKAMAALISDLDIAGLLDDTIILMSGEFGRTPRINRGAGRDHWPRAAFFFLGGGGFTHGQAIGATGPKGEIPSERPVHLQHIFHTLYHQLGIDANTVTLTDPNGRPQYLVDERRLISELL